MLMGRKIKKSLRIRTSGEFDAILPNLESQSFLYPKATISCN